MRGFLACAVVLHFASSAFGSWIQYSQLKTRARNGLLDCLEHAGLDPIVEGDPEYATEALPFNLRFNWKPAALVYPTDSKGVAVEFTIERGHQRSHPSIACVGKAR